MATTLSMAQQQQVGQINQQLQVLAQQWQQKNGVTMAMSIDWQSFWQDQQRTQQATEEALRFMVSCGVKRLFDCYSLSEHNVDVGLYRRLFSDIHEYQLIWVTNTDAVRLSLDEGCLKDYFSVDGFVQYYANVDPFLQNQASINETNG